MFFFKAPLAGEGQRGFGTIFLKLKRSGVVVLQKDWGTHQSYRPTPNFFGGARDVPEGPGFEGIKGRKETGGLEGRECPTKGKKRKRGRFQLREVEKGKVVNKRGGKSNPPYGRKFRTFERGGVGETIKIGIWGGKLGVPGGV